ncbi:MAG: hypothetical protein RLZZ399_2418 [Verrucomicrobiota bacterium]|jgi:hypothetical protein
MSGENRSRGAHTAHSPPAKHSSQRPSPPENSHTARRTQKFLHYEDVHGTHDKRSSPTKRDPKPATPPVPQGAPKKQHPGYALIHRPWHQAPELNRVFQKATIEASRPNPNSHSHTNVSFGAKATSKKHHLRKLPRKLQLSNCRFPSEASMHTRPVQYGHEWQKLRARVTYKPRALPKSAQKSLGFIPVAHG